MSGTVIREGHVCSTPHRQMRGTIWRCDCGQHWELGVGRWWPINRLEVWWLTGRWSS